MLIPVAPHGPSPSGFRYHLGLVLLDPACLVPELDFFHLINSNWATQRAIRLRHLYGPPGLAGYPEIIPTTILFILLTRNLVLDNHTVELGTQGNLFFL